MRMKTQLFFGALAYSLSLLSTEVQAGTPACTSLKERSAERDEVVVFSEDFDQKSRIPDSEYWSFIPSELLLLDEPFSALDFLTRITMQEWLLDQWEQDSKTVLFITHDVEEAIFLSGRVLVVEDTPIRKLHSFEVPAPYPRTRACLTDPKMLELRENLISLLRKEVQA